MDVDAYLDRIGARAGDPLEVLVARHQEAVPFENLSVHLREPIRLEPDALLDKIVRRRRGGFCYELNGAFALLLEALGHDVRRLACVVTADPDATSFPGDHVALEVRTPDRRLLVDVGFGRFARGPIALDVREPQTDRFGVFVVRDTPDGDLEVEQDGAPAYRLETRPRVMTDFVPLAWWHATCPDSPFTHGLTCSRVTDDERITLSGTRFIRTAHDGTRTEQDLTPGELIPAYRTWFGIDLDRVPDALHPPQS